MRTLISITALFLISVPAFADFTPIPEPGIVGLIGIGAVALLVARRRKK